MRKLVWLVWVLLFAIIAVYAVGFVGQNPQNVSVDLLFSSVPPITLGFALIAMFVVGVLWGAVIGAMPFFGYKMREKKLIKERDQAKQELDRLRAQAVKESQ